MGYLENRSLSQQAEVRETIYKCDTSEIQLEGTLTQRRFYASPLALVKIHPNMLMKNSICSTGSDTSGPRIDIPANGSKPRETLHYPMTPPPPPQPTPVNP